MATVFPTNPQTGDEFTIGTTTYKWTGYAWIKVSSETSIKNLKVTNLTATTVSVISTNVSISTTTGALTVAGGVGIGGALYVNNMSFAQGAEILTSATVNNYVIQTAVFAGTDTAVNTSTGIVTVWNTSTFQTVTNRGNSTTNQVRILNNTSATSVGTGALVIAGGISAGGDLWLGGTIYSAGVPVITTSTLIDSFNSGEDIKITTTSTGALTTGTQSIVISNTSTFETVTRRGSTTTHAIRISNTTESTSSSTGAMVIDGGLGVAKRINAESIQIADTVMDSGLVLVNTTDTVVVDEYDIDEYRSSKYLIQIDEGTGPSANFETIELLLLVDNNGNVYATEYAVLTSNGDLGEFAADIIGDKVRLYFTAVNATDKVLRIFRTTMRII
jgi:hypothetical protein